jgi:hypothetical protein
MTQLKIILVFVAFGLILGLGWLSYEQIQANGALQQELVATKENEAALSKAYEDLRVDLGVQQERTSAAVAEDLKNREQVATETKLFRKEIDKLKASNSEYKKLLETRLPNSLLIRLCTSGYATGAACAGVLPLAR